LTPSFVLENHSENNDFYERSMTSRHKDKQIDKLWENQSIFIDVDSIEDAKERLANKASPTSSDYGISSLKSSIPDLSEIAEVSSGEEEEIKQNYAAVDWADEELSILELDSEVFEAPRIDSGIVIGY
jgi:hypothetical protein